MQSTVLIGDRDRAGTHGFTATPTRRKIGGFVVVCGLQTLSIGYLAFA